MRYRLDTSKFKLCLQKKGFSSLFKFAQQNQVHRNTLQGYLAGKEVFLQSFQLVAEALDVDPMDLIVPISSLDSKIQDVSEIAPVVGWLVKQDPQMAIVLLGSRASGRSKKYSDWDLGIVSFPDAITSQNFLKYKDRVEDLSENIVRTVDLINLNQAPRWFLEGVASDVLFLDGNREAFVFLKGVLNGITKQEAQTGAGAP